MDLIHSKLTFRSAVVEDLPAMLSLLNEDILGSQRETLDAAAYAKYESAFHDIRAQDGNQILLAMLADEIVGMLQLTFIPGLSHQGAKRAQIESVRVKASARGKGIGKHLFHEAFELSKQAQCALVQLTTDIRREDAARFYEGLGFKPTHLGMKRPI
nr:GNAT family N-acetyltransferase [uncultured Duganella sp.]